MIYNALKFVHIASIAAWLGGITTMLLLNRLFRREDASAIKALQRQGTALSTRLFMSAAITTVVTGIGMVQVGHLSFGATWITWGIVGAVASVLLGGVLVGGMVRKLGAGVASGAIDAAGAAALQQRILTFGLLNIVLLLSIVWAMVFKP